MTPNNGTIRFSNKRKHYEIGDTITINLDSGENAVFVLTEIKPTT